MTPRAWTRAWLLSGVLVAVAVVCLALAIARPDHPLRAAVVEHGDGAAPAMRDPGRALPAAPPVRLRIPVIGVAARVTQLGLNADRTVEVPSDPATVGWYRLGPPPGAEGSAVILGHVDSVAGAAVFHRLRFLRPGDRLLVDASDGSTTRFRVTRVATYPNQQFPASRVYGPHGRRHGLQLVTCGGAYDPESGYRANVVVYTRIVRG